MPDFISAMILPFIACLLLAGIHVYLGIHVLARKVIFVDLALAQIAALGAVYGVLLGYTTLDSPWVIKGFSLIFTVVGAGVFALTKQRREDVPQEALIGITYAAALAMTILASSHLPHGGDEVRTLLAGSILWVDLKTIISTGILYLAVGILHFVYRKQFLMISFHLENAYNQGLNVRFWDFLFYVAFGFVVTSSVSIAGVLLVFCYLVVPAVVASLLTEKLLNRLYIGWSVGALVSFIGVWYSYVEDLPSGPTIVVCFVLFLVLIATAIFVVRAKAPGKQLLKIVLGAVALALLVYFSTFLKVNEEHSPIVKLHSKEKSERLLALQIIEVDNKLFTVTKEQVTALLKDNDEEIRLASLKVFAKNWRRSYSDFFHNALMDDNLDIREYSLRVLRNHSETSALPYLWNAVRLEKDDYLKVEMAESLLELGDVRVLPILIEIINNGETEMVKKEAFEHLNEHVDLPSEFSYLSSDGLLDWFNANRIRLRWHSLQKKFMVE